MEAIWFFIDYVSFQMGPSGGFIGGFGVEDSKGNVKWLNQLGSLVFGQQHFL